MSTIPDNISYRSLPILGGYLSVCAGLTGYIVHSLYSRLRYLKQHGEKRAEHRYIPLFAALAILSLGATWYHMFSFFAYSYRDWVCRTGFLGSASLTAQDLELWLRDTKLFQEAWGAVVESPWRFWWSEQIFLWTVGWSLFLGISGKNKSYMPCTIVNYKLVLVCLSQTFHPRSPQSDPSSLGVHATRTNCRHFLRPEPILHGCATVSPSSS